MESSMRYSAPAHKQSALIQDHYRLKAPFTQKLKGIRGEDSSFDYEDAFHDALIDSAGKFDPTHPKQTSFATFLFYQFKYRLMQHQRDLQGRRHKMQKFFPSGGISANDFVDNSSKEASKSESVAEEQARKFRQRGLSESEIQSRNDGFDCQRTSASEVETWLAFTEFGKKISTLTANEILVGADCYEGLTTSEQADRRGVSLAAISKARKSLLAKLAA